MKNLTYIGVLVQLIGAVILIYLGIMGTNQSNIGLIIGFILVIAGFLIHIIMDKKLNSLPPTE